MTAPTRAVIVNRHGIETPLDLRRTQMRRLFNLWCASHAHRLTRDGGTVIATSTER